MYIHLGILTTTISDFVVGARASGGPAAVHAVGLGGVETDETLLIHTDHFIGKQVGRTNFTSLKSKKSCFFYNPPFSREKTEKISFVDCFNSFLSIFRCFSLFRHDI